MRWKFIGSVSLALSFVMVLTACGSEQSSSSSGQGSYKEMKTMVIDILKSEDGKKAVEESLSSSSSEGTSGMNMKMMSLQTSTDLKTAVKDTLTAPEYQKKIEKIMTDPKFAGDFAKAIQSQSKELHLQLIKDPTYQKSVEAIMKSPEMMTMFLNLTKTSDYRKQSMKTMQEAMQTPIFRMEVLNLLKKVVQEELEPKEQKKDESGGSSEEKQEGSGDSSSS